MRVTITHTEKTTGLIFRTTRYVVETTVEFSDRELARISHTNHVHRGSE